VKSEKPQLPLYAKATILLVGFLALVTMLYFGRGIFVPLVFAFISAIVLHPVVSFCVRRRINRAIAIVITLLLAFLVVAACGALLYSQARRFSESWPLLVDKWTGVLNQIITWASGSFAINPQKIRDWIARTQGELINTSGAALGQTLMTIGSSILSLVLFPVYVFMILFYQPLLLEFTHRIFGIHNQKRTREIVSQTKSVIQRYLVGLTIEALIVAILNTVALFILGIDYAVLLGVVGAILNLIPLVGGVVAAALPMMVAVATKPTPLYALYVMIAFYVIQFIDNNYIIPKIVASKVKINALFSIIVVIAGNALWGIPGMFLSIPVLAIVKLIFDHVEPLKPWGFLLGDTMPRLIKIKPILERIRKRKST